MVDRVYNINLRSAWLVAPRVKRANSSVDFVRSFVKTNMKAEEVKISQALNEVLWIRGAKKPPSRIQVKVSKDAEGVVFVRLPDEKVEVKEVRTLKDKILRRSAKRVAEEKKEAKKQMTEEEKKEFEEFKKKQQAVVKENKDGKVETPKTENKERSEPSKE